AEDRLQEQTEGDAGRAADEVVPEIADVEGTVHHDHQGLSGHGRKEDRTAAHAPEEKRHQKDPQHDTVEDRSQDIDRLDEVLGEAGEERERYGEETPQGGEPL